MAKTIDGLTTVAAMPSGAGQAAHLTPEVGKQPPKRFMLELDYAKAEMSETVGVVVKWDDWRKIEIGYIKDIRFVEGAWVDGLAEPEPTPTLKIGDIVRVAW